jgi:hypothetical protein
MLQTFEQTVFLKIRELVICECSSCRAMLNDFSAIWRTFYEHPGTGSIICVATLIFIRGRRLFVCSSIKIDFDEQEYVLILVNCYFCALASSHWFQSIFHVWNKGSLYLLHTDGIFYMFCVNIAIYLRNGSAYFDISLTYIIIYEKYTAGTKI